MEDSPINSSQVVDDHLLASIPPFKDLSVKQRAEFLSHATLRRFGASEVLFSEDDPAEHFYIVVAGFIRLMRITPEGEQVVVHHAAPGDLFGIARALSHPVYALTAKSASEGMALAWPSEIWDELFEASPTLGDVTRRTLKSRMIEMQDRVVELATRPVSQRIALSLIRLAEQTGRETQLGTEIGFPMTRQDISDLTGANMHSVSRYMSAWQREGIVLSNRKRLIVAEPDALTRLSGRELA